MCVPDVISFEISLKYIVSVDDPLLSLINLEGVTLPHDVLTACHPE